MKWSEGCSLACLIRRASAPQTITCADSKSPGFARNSEPPRHSCIACLTYTLARPFLDGSTSKERHGGLSICPSDRSNSSRLVLRRRIVAERGVRAGGGAPRRRRGNAGVMSARGQIRGMKGTGGVRSPYRLT